MTEEKGEKRDMEETKERQETGETVGKALPEFISVSWLLKAAAMLGGETEERCGKMLREAIKSNRGEGFGGLVDFLAEIFGV